jgi:dTDP-4-amino-4,6-dideoxygalactose transaminase
MTSYSLASSTWNEKEYSAIQRVIESDMFSMGKEVAQYEQDFANFFGSKYALMVSSGSTANLLMIAALFFTKNESLKLKRGDEIIVPAVSWSTTYFPLQQYGLKVKFVDIDRNTLNMDLDKLEAAITVNTKAILSVNLLGNPNDYNRMNEIIAGRNIFILEDNCESMGATIDGKQAGTFGVMGTYSSFFSHHIATMEGGCVVTDDEELYHILLCIRAHGWTRNLPKFNKVTGEKSDDNFEESFKFVLPGYNVRPLEMSGALGIEFSNHPFIDIQKETGSSSWFGFSLILNEKAPYKRAELVKLLTDNGIECRPIVTGNFLKNTEVLEYFDYETSGTFEAAEYLDKHGLFVGNHQNDITKELKFLYALLITS